MLTVCSPFCGALTTVSSCVVCTVVYAYAYVCVCQCVCVHVCAYVCVFIKFHYWNLNGYSDLSVEEGIVGRRVRICVK